MHLLARLEQLHTSAKTTLGFALIAGIGLLDLLTGYELSFSLFYVVPIALLTWLVNRRLGIIASLASALIWLSADIASGNSYTHVLIPAWNALIRLAFFIVITSLLAALKNGVERERALSRTDSLTGAANARHFYELAETEMTRARRYQHPLTVAYVDLDNFKPVNDQFGHAAGDQILCTVVRQARKHMRQTDVIARLGGDEFAVLLPETNQEAARRALTKLKDDLLAAMQQAGWSVTFSIGVLSCEVPPGDAKELINLADRLMYAVKRDGKNAIKFASYEASNRRGLFPA